MLLHCSVRDSMGHINRHLQSHHNSDMTQGAIISHLYAGSFFSLRHLPPHLRLASLSGAARLPCLLSEPTRAVYLACVLAKQRGNWTHMRNWKFGIRTVPRILTPTARPIHTCGGHRLFSIPVHDSLGVSSAVFQVRSDLKPIWTFPLGC